MASGPHEDLACPRCATGNRAGARFCRECGTTLSPACPACAALTEPGQRFCDECGAALVAERRLEPAAAGAPSPEAERRLVSVLFADLVGFTAMAERRDAEEVRELLSRYFDDCRRRIDLYGGTVEKFIGDAVMAVWGAPTAQEDDAERAVRAALDLVDAVAGLGADLGVPELRLRAGVLTGEAAVTLGAEGQGLVAGDLVNTASRIQSLAEPGAVLVGEVTRRATEAAIAYEAAGARELKGKAEPIPVWRALRVTAGRAGALKSVGAEPPFVGRDRELRLVKELFHASAENATAHLVSVAGVAGVGKSRLAWEFYKYIDGLAALVYYHRGRCPAYGEGVTYWALAEMVRMRGRIAEGEEAASARAKLRDAVAEYVADPDERAWVESHLAHLLGLEERHGREREELFAAWRLFFERLAEREPTVLVFEDLQWADASLLDFIAYLLEWSRGHRLFVLALARPELAERHPGWAAGTRNTTALSLEPLAPAAMEELIADLVPGLPDELRARILDRAEGIPLYAVETVRVLIDRGLLEREGDRYRPARPIDALEVPETLHALLAARLDGLDSEERSLLRDAAVLGKTFSRPALAAVSHLPEDHLDRLLAGLVRKEVLSLQADPRSPERGRYAFLQELLKKVAYETLARRERRERHLAAAAHLEEAWGSGDDEVVEVVAAHYLDAWRAAPQAADADAIRDRARELLERAGERAGSLGAGEEARRYFGQAADLADEPVVEAGLRERAGEAAWAAARADDAEAQLRRAIRLFTDADRTHSAARVAAKLGEVEWQRGQLAQAVDRMEDAFAVLSAEEPDADVALLAAELGRLHVFSGDLPRAKERIEVALALAEALWLPEALCQALITAGVIAGFEGRMEQTLALTRHALDLALEHDLLNVAARAYNNLGDVLDRRDRLEEASAQHRSALALARRVGNHTWEAVALSELSHCLMRSGRWDEALAAVPSGHEGERLANEVAGLQTLVEIAVERGLIEEAHRVVALAESFEGSADVQVRQFRAAVRATVLRAEGRHEEVLALGDEIRFPLALMLAHQPVKRAYADVLDSALALGRLDRAEVFLERLQALRPGELPPFLRAQEARMRARLAAARAQADGVEPGFKLAAGIFREFGLPFWLGVTLLEHAEWLIDQGRAEEAEPLLREARGLFDDLEARPWVERAARAGGTADPARLAAARP
jgi:class 3 adenylate cyclase/tetratricopeptide (TPR) repeat protein